MNIFFREVNEDNVLIRNILGEFEDSLKYVSSPNTQLPMPCTLFTARSIHFPYTAQHHGESVTQAQNGKS